ncbi:unnamed protein product [Soboliphyme baturini]|uniref:Uncharacterized protein n=1 Tax=Soboliphyme baturini TaxID=241478 RepID=A0A183J3W4_9BILA|nr:unnamed protein product [Soboliphyme baturini]
MTEVEENPFRPDGNLCHEVDPIVESYRRKPYPTELDNVAGFDSVYKDTEYKANGSEVAMKPTQISLNVANGDKPETKLVEQKTVPSPKAGTVEVVHLKPKKRSCRCCAVQ